MKDYIISVLLVALCSGIADHVFPDSERSEKGNGLKMIGSVCILSAIILPLTPLFNNFGILDGYIDNALEILKFGDPDASEIEKYDEMFKEELICGGLAYVEQQIESDICKRFSIDTKDCMVRAELSENGDGDGVISSVTVTLCGDAKWKDPYAIEDFVSGAYGCRCSVFSSSN